jgi:hypothetical protein
MKYWIFLSGIVLAWSVQAAYDISLPPFTFHGEIVKWNGAAFGTNDDAQVVAKLNGTNVVDRCNLVSGAYPATNYRLLIPLSETPQPGRAQAGDDISFEVYYDGAVHAVMDAELLPKVGHPATYINVNMVVGTDSNTNGLPDEYEALLEPYYMLYNNLTNLTANHDFDGDGFSNLQEFLAGTVPVIGGDYPAINGWTSMPAGWFAFTFLSAPGRTYTIQGADPNDALDWSAEVFSRFADEEPSEMFLSSQDDGVITLYLCPTNRAKLYTLQID